MGVTGGKGAGGRGGGGGLRPHPAPQPSRPPRPPAPSPQETPISKAKNHPSAAAQSAASGPPAQSPPQQQSSSSTPCPLFTLSLEGCVIFLLALRVRRTQQFPQFPRPLHQRRPRRIQQLIAHNKHAPIPYRRHICPCRQLVNLLRLTLVASSRPSQHNHFRPRLRHLLIANLFPRRNNHLSAADLHQLRHPRRRANPRIRPSLAIHPYAPLQFLRRACNRSKFRTHLPNQRPGLRRSPRNSSQQPNIRLNIVQRPRIHRHKVP